MLKYAEKYNWWTPGKKKKDISLEVKIEYLLERGTIDELKQAVKEIGGSKIYSVWKQVFKDKNRILKRRNKWLEYFVLYYKDYKVK